jgi:integrase
VVHHRALPYAALPALWLDIAALPGIPPLALRFLILTATRTGEVIGARHDELDLEARVWTVPATRTKTKIVHRVPLSEAAMAILEQVPRVNEFVFPGFRQDAPINNIALRLVLTKGLGRRDIVVHGFRSTFRDYCAERTNYPREIAEQALGHATGSAVEQAYRRSDLLNRRRALMEEYSRFATTPAADATVVPIRSRA